MNFFSWQRIWFYYWETWCFLSEGYDFCYGETCFIDIREIWFIFLREACFTAERYSVIKLRGIILITERHESDVLITERHEFYDHCYCWEIQCVTVEKYDFFYYWETWCFTVETEVWSPVQVGVLVGWRHLTFDYFTGVLIMSQGKQVMGIVYHLIFSLGEGHGITMSSAVISWTLKSKSSEASAVCVVFLC